MASNSLNTAKIIKNDEFYTQLKDIEDELQYYTKHLENKIVLCNCDNPKYSNFYKFFYDNFEKLKLKKLIATFMQEKNGMMFEVCIKNNSKVINKTQLKQNGDFRSNEMINILDKVDIVITNPPFSLFREFIEILIKHNKLFLVIGNANAITYKKCFEYIAKYKMWLGHNCVRRFISPEKKIVEGARSFWYSNLPTDKQKRHIQLIKKYSPKEYRHYDNYNAIEVSKTKDIPYDFDGVMGVPVTFLDKYNPNQFVILGSDYNIKEGKIPSIINSKWEGKLDRAYIDGKRLYSRIFIKRIRRNDEYQL